MLYKNYLCKVYFLNNHSCRQTDGLKIAENFAITAKPEVPVMTTGTAQNVEALTIPNLTNLNREQTIRQYHVLKKQLAAIDKNPLFPTEATREARRQLLRAQLAVIGIDAYQDASRKGELLGAGFDSSVWVLNELSNEASTILKCERPIRILDVGSIVHRFPDAIDVQPTEKIPLDVTSIDLNPEDSADGRRVIKADFFHFAASPNNSTYDIICLSLCVNFEGCPKRRGLMLYLASRLLRNGGLLFFVLPRACVDNSRYCNEHWINQVLSACGLEMKSCRYTQKLFLNISKRSDVDSVDDIHLARRKIVRMGDKRNNFSICFDEQYCKKMYGRATGNDKKGKREKVKRCGKYREMKTKRPDMFKKRLTSNQRKRARRQAKRAHRGKDGGV